MCSRSRRGRSAGINRLAAWTAVRLFALVVRSRSARHGRCAPGWTDPAGSGPSWRPGSARRTSSRLAPRRPGGPSRSRRTGRCRRSASRRCRPDLAIDLDQAERVVARDLGQARGRVGCRGTGSSRRHPRPAADLGGRRRLRRRSDGVRGRESEFIGVAWSWRSPVGEMERTTRGGARVVRAILVTPSLASRGRFDRGARSLGSDPVQRRSRLPVWALQSHNGRRSGASAPGPPVARGPTGSSMRGGCRRCRRDRHPLQPHGMSGVLHGASAT